MIAEGKYLTKNAYVFQDNVIRINYRKVAAGYVKFIVIVSAWH